MATTSVEVFRIIEVDMSNRSDSTESCWLDMESNRVHPSMDYTPLCMSLVARAPSDVQETNGDRDYHIDQLTDFISDVYYRNHAFIDVDDY